MIGLAEPFSISPSFQGEIYAATFRRVFRYRHASAAKPPRFEAVPKLDTDSWRFLAVDECLLVATGNGLMERCDQTLTMPDKHSSFALTRSRFDADRIYAGQADGLRILHREGGRWNVSENLLEFETEIYAVEESGRNKIWISEHSARVHRLFLKESLLEVESAETYSGGDLLTPIRIGDDVVFSSLEGISEFVEGVGKESGVPL